MKIKFNWGTGIFIVITLFLSFFIGVIIFSFNQKINFVSKDYYPKEIEYQKQIEKIKNYNALNQSVNCVLSQNKIKICFPEFFRNKEVKGEIHFFYIKDYEQDTKYYIKFDSDICQTINVENFPKGRYYVKIDWTIDSVSYFKEFKIKI